MATERSNMPALRLWQWIKNQVIQPAPDDITICEFDCRKQQCALGEWQSCDRRLTKAAGELMPQRRDPPASV